MPVYSMTGYACVQSFSPVQQPAENTTTEPAPQWQLTLELRAVNSRFLDASLKFPEELRAFETLARELLQKQVRRGKVEWRAQLEKCRPGEQAEWSLPDQATLQHVVQWQKEVLDTFPAAAPLSVAELHRLLASGAPKPVLTELESWIPQRLADVLVQFQAARQKEGEKLSNSLRERTGQLRALCQQVQPLIPQMIEQQRQRFLDKWQEALQHAGSSIPAEAAHERALTEAAAFALRIDVAEELDRILAHVQAIDTLLEQGDALGKRLDFLMQELHREANTLGSKSVSLEGSRISMDMKVLIEQMREQVQNIE